MFGITFTGEQVHTHDFFLYDRFQYLKPTSINNTKKKLYECQLQIYIRIPACDCWATIKIRKNFDMLKNILKELYAVKMSYLISLILVWRIQAKHQNLNIETGVFTRRNFFHRPNIRLLSGSILMKLTALIRLSYDVRAPPSAGQTSLT